MTEIFSAPQQNCPLQRKGWIGVEEMRNLIRTKKYLSQTQKLLQSMEAGEKKNIDSNSGKKFPFS